MTQKELDLIAGDIINAINDALPQDMKLADFMGAFGMVTSHLLRRLEDQGRGEVASSWVENLVTIHLGEDE